MKSTLKFLYVAALVLTTGAFALDAAASCTISPTSGLDWDSTTFTYTYTDSMLVYRDGAFVNVIVCSSPFNETTACGGPLTDWATTDGLYTFIGAGAAWSTTEGYCGGSHTPTECESGLSGASIAYDTCTRQLGEAPTPTPTPTPTTTPEPTITDNTPTTTVGALIALRDDARYYYFTTFFLVVLFGFFYATGIHKRK